MVALGPIFNERQPGTKKQEVQSLLLASLLMEAYKSQVTGFDDRCKSLDEKTLLSAARQVVQEGHVKVHLT